ncbi:MAG: hypothetical protein F6K40_36235 [Okeania sp. SIO3I5]|uniref:hypothetical protein n=1 Tax=Okeania sp. SIO3I5 TaxID=2607805 RepID=UPI0013B629C4|nr:hypothetical protein [Okeania sp. SIO3I5]NEQ41357.1 hypothetical protein [Okeania sp. SIO3I5]
MPTPQQKAAAGIKADIALQLETIQLAKKDTLKALKKQRVQAQQVYKLSKQLLAEQIAQEKQSLTKQIAEEKLENSITTIEDSETDKQQEEAGTQETTVAATATEENDGTASKAPPVEKGKKVETKIENSSFTQSAAKTINQFQLEVNSACQIIQAGLAENIKQLGNNINDQLDE